jgi:glucose-6-phosphate isomerase
MKKESGNNFLKNGMIKEYDLKDITPNIRFLNDIKDVLFDEKWYSVQKENFELYYMYRNLEKKDNLRYDITIIPPFFMGQEPVKTLGHFHQLDSNEMYIVLEGEGLFLLQKGKDKVEEFFVINGKKGDCIIVPKGFAHVTINPTKDKTLKMANWVKDESSFDYETIKNKKGLCYYFTLNGWIKNNNYQDIPKIKFKEPDSYPKSLDFLK